MFWKKEIKGIPLVLVFILLLAFLLRALNLIGLPIFTDEAIYVRWTQIANWDPNWRFISLTDGKQPLFIWLSIISQRIFSDPLFAGRFVSALAGVFTSLGIYFLGKELFNKKTALLAAFIWAVFPFALWHDRLAMMDSLLTCFFAWGYYLEILLAKRLKLDIALLLGVVIGAGMLTKSSAQFLLYLLPFSLLLVRIKFKFPNKKLFRWLKLAAVVVFSALLINSVQRLSPFYYIVGLKNLTFLYSTNEILSFGIWKGILRFWGNARSLSSWLAVYSNTLLVFALIPFLEYKKKWREKLLLLIYFFLPFLALAFFAKIIYARFMLFMTIPLIILAGEGLNKIFRIKKSLLPTAICLILFSYIFYFDFQIVFNQINAPLPANDRGQYIDDWPAGWGVKEVSALLAQKAAGEKIVLGTEGTFGLTPAAFEIYLKDNPNIEIKGFWPISDGISWLKEKSLEKPTFLVLKDTQEPKPEWPIELIAKFKRGKGDNYLGFYRVVN